MMLRIYKLFATALGAGYSPFASGTVGALVGLLAWWPLSLVSDHSYWQFIFLPLLILLTTWLGALASKKLEPEWGEDPSLIVIDEVVGMWISLLLIPLNWQYFLIGFLLFRLFDIWKPLGIRRLEAVGEGWGVMLDDVLAGVYSNLLLQLIVYFWVL